MRTGKESDKGWAKRKNTEVLSGHHLKSNNYLKNNVIGTQTIPLEMFYILSQ
jgi:hypothetical protein